MEKIIKKVLTDKNSYGIIFIEVKNEGMSEWLKEADCKSASRKTHVGSNPTPLSKKIIIRSSSIGRAVGC